MCGDTLNMTGTEAIEGYTTFKPDNMTYSCLQSLKSCHLIPVRFHKPSNLLFGIHERSKGLSTNSASSSNVQIEVN